MEVELIFPVLLLCCGGLLLIEVIVSLQHGEAVGYALSLLALVTLPILFFALRFTRFYHGLLYPLSNLKHAMRGTLRYKVVVLSNFVLATTALVGAAYLFAHR